MPAQKSSWSTEQLTEFLAAITQSPDEETAVRAAVERAAESLECEIGALVRDGSVVTSVGFMVGSVPEEDLIEASCGNRRELALPGQPPLRVIAAPLEDPEAGRMIVARSGSDEFWPEEVIVLRGMARILGMTLTTIRTVESLREGHKLFERSAAIQRAITLRAPLQEVLDLITQAARELLGDEVVALRMVDPSEPATTRTVSSSGVQPDVLRDVEHGLVGQGVGGRAIAEGRLVVTENYAAAPKALPVFVERGLQAAMAAPIHDRGTVIGSLLVASYRHGRRYSPSEQEMLVAFAQHASLALLDARTVDELLQQALHDPLTSLANRALLLDRLEHAVARAEREGSSVAVLFVDLDRFKGVNDSLGHTAGDALLVQVGERLSALTRATDTVARLGGDEFVVLLEDVTEQSTAARLATAMIERLRTPFLVDGDEIFLTASVGIALARRRDDQPLRDADLAMYRAKSGGKDRYEFFEEGMRIAMLDRLELELDLKRALDRNEFALYYQPIVDLTTGEIAGLEALIRWQHPERGFLLPAAFIPLSEETGAIFSIGRWVLSEACRRASTWQLDQADSLRPYVSVNLAPVQLQQPGLVGEIADILADTRLDPARLVLEITESSLLADSKAIQRLRALKDLGVRLAVDDFGTGYSSLHYLQQFPLDALKIAKPFIDELDTGTEDSALATAIVELGRTFQLDVIAEGIERITQLARLRELGCQAGQGFLLAHPQDGETTDALLRDPAGFAFDGRSWIRTTDLRLIRAAL